MRGAQEIERIHRAEPSHAAPHIGLRGDGNVMIYLEDCD
jgi:hypothetical protein